MQQVTMTFKCSYGKKSRGKAKQYYLILKNTSSEANSSSWKMWLGENHKWSRSRKRPKRLQYRGDIPKADKETETTHCPVKCPSTQLYL